MKISYRTHPILKTLESGRVNEINICDSDSDFFKLNMSAFAQRLEKYLPFFKKEVISLSEPFADAAFLAAPKLFGIYQDESKDFEVSATFLYKGIVTMAYQKFEKNSDAITTAIFEFTKDGRPLLFFVDDALDFQLTWLSIVFGISAQEEALKLIHREIAKAAIMELFRKYAVVETKELKAGQKLKGIYCNYKNDTKTDVTFLDSKWFTTLVKSDAFNVRGHFRLQPKKKDGEWTKELIWINEFQKDGYTAPARKLKEH